ncbi:hypothetical protein GOV06_05440 [Candidatus Woesearchaeota archaeon]|nr:hypothetical protein [Candidatus Woesearchaeota archaeon]
MNKKAQAAMEFLMTYGWALLVVLAAIGALAYFGVLSPERFLPEKCVLVPGVACLDFKVTTTNITLIISNSLGRDMTVTNVAAVNCSQAFNQELKNGDQFEFTMTGCDNGEVDARFKGDIVIDYTSKDSGLEKTIRGSMSAKIQ